jgi:hypothetical protein
VPAPRAVPAVPLLGCTAGTSINGFVRPLNSIVRHHENFCVELAVLLATLLLAWILACQSFTDQGHHSAESLNRTFTSSVMWDE